MSHQEERFQLKHLFELVTNLPRAAVIGAMHFVDNPKGKSRLALAGATVAAGFAFGLSGAVLTAAFGLAAGGMAVQAFALPICGVPRENPEEFLGTKEALKLINSSRERENKAPLAFPKIDI
jgi:hypothetical protein